MNFHFWVNIKDIHTCRSGTFLCVVINSMEMCPAFRWKFDWSCLGKKSFSHDRFYKLVGLVNKIIQILISKCLFKHYA